jgi:hypothetical protein
VELRKQDVVDPSTTNGVKPRVSPPTKEGFFMITRRGFFGFLAASVGIVAKVSFASRLERYLVEHNAPLLEVPQRPSTIITACREMESLNIGDPYKYPEPKTWRRYLEDVGDIVPGKRISFRRLYDDHGMKQKELDEECPDYIWFPNWCRTESPNAEAFFYLSRLDLGPELDGSKPGSPYLHFQDGPCPGSDYLGVQFSCDRALSLLQNRLNELGTGAAVVVDE